MVYEINSRKYLLYGPPPSVLKSLSRDYKWKHGRRPISASRTTVSVGPPLIIIMIIMMIYHTHIYNIINYIYICIGTVPRDDYDTSSSPPHHIYCPLKTIVIILWCRSCILSRLIEHGSRAYRLLYAFFKRGEQVNGDEYNMINVFYSYAKIRKLCR